MESFPWEVVVSAITAIIGWFGGKAKGRVDTEKKLTGRD